MSSVICTIGILALQGAVAPHVGKLQQLGVKPVPIRRRRDFENIDGLIIPGGESSTLIHLLNLEGLWHDLFLLSQKIPFWGICAGSILMAARVTNPEQESLGIIDMDVQRNAYGRQLESFIDHVTTPDCLKNQKHVPPQTELVFIRAPKITAINKDTTEVLLEYQNDPVWVRQGKHLAATFHPELTKDTHLHQYFVDLVVRMKRP